MWSHLSLFLIVGVAVSYCDHHQTETHEYAWNKGKEYKYLVRSTTMTSLDEPYREATGITMKGILVIQAVTPNTLYGKVHELQYAHKEEIPKKQSREGSQKQDETYRNVPISGKSFQIIVKNGVIRELMVQKKVPIWEVNILKSIISQLQVDTHGENIIPSKYNQMPEDVQQPFASYKVMEDSVGGNCEVIYDILPIEEDLAKNKPEMIPLPSLDGENFIEIRKTKDFKNCKERYNYLYNQTNQQLSWPFTSKSDPDTSVSKVSMTRMIISGNLKHFTTQSSVTKSTIFIKSDRKDRVIGNVYSIINLTLVEVNSKFKDLEQKIELMTSTGNLIFMDKNPFAESHIHPYPIIRNLQQIQSSDKSRLKETLRSDFFDNDSNSNSNSSEEKILIDFISYPPPRLNEAPYNPFMPVFIGLSGKNSSEDFNAEVLAANLIMRIAKAIEDPTVYKPDEMIETFTILQDLLRTMITDQLTEVEQRALKLSGDSIRDTVQKVIYKTIAQIGTGPSLLKLTNWIKNAVFSNVDAAILIARIPKTIRILTAEYLKHFYELLFMPEIIDKDVLNVSAPIAFAELIRIAQDDRRRYAPNGRMMITNEELEMYISYFAKQLREAIQKNDGQRIHTYIAALSYTGHPKILSVFEPYLEGKQPVSKCQRKTMVTGLSRLARTYPTLARSVLAKIYLNTRENDEIRVAAFFSLIKTDPPMITYMRIAQFTNYDRSSKVNYAVANTIRSLAMLKHARAQHIAFKARLARKLLNKKSVGFLNSISYYTDTDNEDTLLRSFYVETMGSGKTDVNYIHVGLNVVNDYLKLSNFRFGYGVSDVTQILNFFGSYSPLLPKREKQKRTHVEELVNTLDIESQLLEPLEGYIFSESKYETQFYPFDRSSLERDISRTVTNISKVLSEDFSVNTVYNHDEILGFPTETGLPFVHTIQTPIVQKLKPKDPEISLDKDIKIETAIEMLFASRVQNRWGFTVPFEFQQYFAGIDRDFHTYLPAKLKIKKQLDGDHVQLQLSLNPALLQKNQEDHSLMYFSTLPFVIRHDVLDFEPLSRNNILQKKIQETSERDKFQVGIFQILIEGQEKVIQTPNLSNIIRLFSSASQEENSYKKIDISVNTAVKGLHLSVAQAKSNTNNPANHQKLDLQKFALTDRQPNSEARRKQFLTEVSKGLQSSHNHVWDIDVGYPTNTSQKLTHQVITIGVGHSNANKKYHTIFYWNIQPAMSENVDNEILSTGITELSQETPLDFERMLNKREQDSFEYILQYGKNYVDGEKVHIKGNTLQSNDLKNTLRNNEIIKECLRNIKDNKESQACQKATQLVRLKDRVNFSVATDSDEQIKIAEFFFDLFSRIYNRIVEKISPRANKKNIIDVEVKMSQDRDKADVFVSSFDKDISLSLSSYSNTPLLELSPSTLSWEWLSEVSQFASKLLWPLPVEVGQHLATGLLSSQWLERIQSQWEPSWKLLSLEKQIDSLLKDEQQPSTCNVGKRQVTTFDGKTYPIYGEKYWKVLMIPTPRYEKTISEDEKVSVLIREKDGHKELRFLLGSKDVDVRKTNDDIQVLVDGHPVKQYNMQDKPDNTSYQIYDNDQVYVEIYELPDKSIEIKSCKYGANVVYNGETVAIQVADQYTNGIRGLCGNYDSKSDNDFLSPQNCIAQKPQDFNAMYTLMENSQHGYIALNKDKQYPCVQQIHNRSNVISDIEAGRSPLDWSPYSKKASRKEIKDHQTEISFTYRTKMEEKDDELCFSTRPIPLCEANLPTKTKLKTFEFFCVPKNEASEQLKLRIEKGANPDFSQKPVSFKKAYEVPLTCRAA